MIFGFSIAPSGPPRDFRETSKNSSSVTFEWKRPLKLNGFIVRYTIHYHKKEMNNNQVKHFTGSSGTISGLSAYTPYQFNIACETNGGIGPHSDKELEVRTSETCKITLTFFNF